MPQVPQQIPLNLDTVTGRQISYQLGAWVYGPQLNPTVQTLTTGSTVTINDDTELLVVNPATVLATLAIKLPADPIDGDVVKIAFGGTIATGASVVTALTITANTGQTLYAVAPTSPATGGTVLSYQYVGSTKTWYKV